MNRNLLKYLYSACFLVFGAASAQAQTTAPMQCDAGSGIWRDADAGILEGAICQTQAGSHGLYRLNFETHTGQFAPSIPGSEASLHFLYASPNTLFYADDKEVYAVEHEHFKVIWHKPYAHAEILPADPYDEGHIAILSKKGESSELHLLRFDGKGAAVEEEMTASFQTTPLQFAWQSSRIVVLEAAQMTIWTRPGMQPPPYPAATDGTQSEPSYPETPSSYQDDPMVISLDPAITPGDFMLDQSGLMVLTREAKKLTYYRFETSSWTRASINATATIRALGFSPHYAMGVTIDANTVRIVARLGSFLQNRFEAKYWHLSNPESATLVIGQDNIAALDGGSDNRAQTIDTTDMTWKRLALVNYPAPGKIADLKDNTLITIHPAHSSPLILWDAQSGKQINAIPTDALQGADIEYAHILPTLKRFVFVLLSNKTYILIDRESGQFTQPLTLVKDLPTNSDTPESLQFVENNIIFPNEIPAVSWQVWKDTQSNAPVKIQRALSDYSPQEFEELQTPQEKWYGYCLSDNDCLIPSSTPTEHPRKIPEVKYQPQNQSHTPPWIAWVLAILSFLSMFGVMLWRRGYGKKSLLKMPKENKEDLSAETDIFDEEHRRFISDRDNRYFLAPNLLSKPVFRLSASILLGLIVSLCVAIPYFFDDTYSTFLSWVIVLTLPVTAITWITISWTYWNRYYLLRFGCITEGKWLHCATTKQSVAYTPNDETTYELSRHQWHRADYVPMIIFDPARPNFAIQYSGESSHALAPLGKLQENPKPACTYDLARLGLVLGLLAITLLGTQALYKSAFPNPLSTWKLNQIAQHIKSDSTFTLTCLKACHSNDTACHDQCHHRQLSLVLDRTGKTSDEDPDMTPAQFLDIQRQTVAKAREILNSDLSCQEKESQIASLTLWPNDLTIAFWKTYANLQTFEAAQLEPIYNDLQKDSEYLTALCDYRGKCAHDSKDCHTPPSCTGAVDSLKIRVCSFQNAIRLPGKGK